METIEYQINPRIDRDWPEGPWDNEPDKIQWEDEATGYPCLLVRNRMGALCGYVGVPAGHRFHGVGYDDVRIGDSEVYDEHSYPPAHCGLTFSDKCHEGVPEAEGICHVPGLGEPDDPWWLGFDCAHGGDVIPHMLTLDEKYGGGGYWREGTYKDVAYVKANCAELAAWLKAVA